jgi:hypothetical protein
MTVAVLCGLGERAELERLRPDLVLDSTAQLADHLPKHGQDAAPWIDVETECDGIPEPSGTPEHSAVS